jgi:hypothetical protein
VGIAFHAPDIRYFNVEEHKSVDAVVAKVPHEHVLFSRRVGGMWAAQLGPGAPHLRCCDLDQLAAANHVRRIKRFLAVSLLNLVAMCFVCRTVILAGACL